LASGIFYLYDPELLIRKINYSIERFLTILEFFTLEDSSGAGADIRLSIWGVIWDEVSSSPFSLLFGNGELGVHSLGETYVEVDRIRGYAIFPVDTPESQYFDTLFRSGLIGVIFIFLILFRIIYISFKLLMHDSKFSYIYKPIIIGFTGVAVTFIFLPLLRDRNFALFFFSVYAVLSSRIHHVLLK
jgi:O-antigen ligase